MVMKYKAQKGEKRLFGFGPKVKRYETRFHKGSSSPGLEIINFDPKGYEGKNYDERKNLAYQDAKIHQKFYEALIREGVYPKGTKIKVKRKRHSDGYTLDLSMPKIKTPFKHPGDMQERKRHKKQRGEIIDKIRKIKEEYSNELFEPALHEDVYHDWNYGIDPKTKKVIYHDFEVLKDPFFTKKHKEYQNREKIKKMRNTAMLKNLEGMLKKYSLTILFVLTFLGIVLLNPEITGNIISSNNFLPSIGGIALIILALFLLFFKIKTKRR